MTYSVALQQFCATWLAWAEEGGPDGDPFSRWAGLCSCAEWADKAAGFVRTANQFIGPIEVELRRVFRREYNCSSYPFGEDDYDRRSNYGLMHLSEDRKNFCRRVAGLP